MDIFQTILVPDAQVTQARESADTVPGCGGMFTVACSGNGEMPATFWLSSGYVPEELLPLMPVNTLFSDQDPFAVLTEAGLQMVQVPTT